MVHHTGVFGGSQLAGDAQLMATYKIEHLSTNQISPVIVDVSSWLYEMDQFNLYSDGRISTAALTLRAEGGAFLTDDNNGLTPILASFDRIRITVTDSDGRAYSHIFEIINDLGQLTRNGEYLLPLTLEGRERALAQIPFSAYADPPISSYQMMQDIMMAYGIARNSASQPVIDLEGDTGQDNNMLPKYNLNIWDFLYIDNCLDALISVVRLSSQSVPAGGGGDRYAIIFDESATSTLKINMRIVPQGENNSGATPLILRADDIENPITLIARTLQPLTGTVVIARGRPGSGGVPVEGDVYRSRLEEYQRITTRQIWSNTITYAAGSYTSINGILYVAARSNTGVRPGTSAADWTAVTIGTYIGDIQYSPFTEDKATIFKNECTNPQTAFASNTEDSPKMLDCNILIDDVETQRDWVHIRQITDAVSGWTTDERKYAFRGTNAYEGFRILVDASIGTPAGAFSGSTDAYGTGAGNDPTGKPYRNNACVYIEGVWHVLKNTADFDQILVRFEGLFEWNTNFADASRFPASDPDNPNRRFRISKTSTPGTRAWRPIKNQFLANDCLHSPTSIQNVTGLINPERKNASSMYTDNSAVRITYDIAQSPDTDQWRLFLDHVTGIITAAGGFIGTFAVSAASSLYGLVTSPYYRNAGWWITLSAPFPFSTHNGISEQVGQLYGAGDAQSVSVLNRHSRFDAYNKTSTFTGKPGWTESDSDTMMEITGVSFLYKLDIQVNGTTIPFTGDVPCSYWAIDDNGTLWKQKSVYRHLKDVQRMTFNYADFTPVYRARTPFGINTIITNILTPELEIRERLFPNRIRMQGFMLEAPYDEHGRYIPNLWETVIKPSIVNLFKPSAQPVNVSFIGEIDYLQWIKTPVAIAYAPGATRTLVPEFRDYPNISNIEQLKRAANADIDVETFQFEQYVIKRNDRMDLSLQDTVYMYEQYIIPQAEAPRPVSAPAWSATVRYGGTDTVSFSSVIYVALVPSINVSPGTDGTVWMILADPVLHTRKLTVGEISATVSASMDIEITHTLIRRIPRII